jgi:hypothetical protein
MGSSYSSSGLKMKVDDQEQLGLLMMTLVQRQGTPLIMSMSRLQLSYLFPRVLGVRPSLIGSL